MRLEDLIREAIQFGAHHKEEINNSGYDSYDATMKKFLNKHQVKNLFIHSVMCCSFCKEKIKFGEQEYMHKNGCGCMDELPERDENFDWLDTGHTVTNGYPLE